MSRTDIALRSMIWHGRFSNLLVLMPPFGMARNGQGTLSTHWRISTSYVEAGLFR
jgi:hypothetical protein